MGSHKRFAFPVFRGVYVFRSRASFLVSLVSEHLVFLVNETGEPSGHLEDILLVQLLPSRIVERDVFEDVAEEYLAVFGLGDFHFLVYISDEFSYPIQSFSILSRYQSRVYQYRFHSHDFRDFVLVGFLHGRDVFKEEIFGFRFLEDSDVFVK